ncbi:MAG UNVERIFIED_CONTAM: hypothetical protein LVR18_26330 [Planctomycetaceae bacterium]|jgi:hypothetical protein
MLTLLTQDGAILMSNDDGDEGAMRRSQPSCLPGSFCLCSRTRMIEAGRHIRTESRFSPI